MASVVVSPSIRSFSFFSCFFFSFYFPLNVSSTVDRYRTRIRSTASAARKIDSKIAKLRLSVKRRLPVNTVSDPRSRSIFTRREQGGGSSVFITARPKWKPIGVEIRWTRATSMTRHPKRKIRKNHNAGVRSVFFVPLPLPPGLFLLYRDIRRERKKKKRDKGGRSEGARTRLISTVRRASFHPAYVNYINCARGVSRKTSQSPSIGRLARDLPQ